MEISENHPQLATYISLFKVSEHQLR